jgi:hypothetical protein
MKHILIVIDATGKMQAYTTYKLAARAIGCHYKTLEYRFDYAGMTGKEVMVKDHRLQWVELTKD